MRLCKNPRLAPWLGVVLLWLLVGPRFARAITVLDQGFDPHGNITLSAGFGGINSNQHRAETFVVGQTGTLVMVNVLADRFNSTTGGNLTFDIVRQTATAVPSDVASDLLLQIEVPSTTVPNSLGFFGVDTTAANLKVTLGEKLAIVMFADASTPSGVIYQWNGQNTDPYANGTEWEEVVGNHTWINEGAAFDLGFETFVSVPEPTSMLLTVVCATALLRRWR